MDWGLLIVTFFGGGIILYIFEAIRKKGKIILDECSLELHYNYKNLVTYILYFNLDIQFINSSGYQKILKKFAVRYFNGQYLHELNIKDHTVRPASIIEARQVKCLQFIVMPYNLIENPLISIFDNSAYLEVIYVDGMKKRRILIQANEIKLIDDTFKPAVA